MAKNHFKFKLPISNSTFLSDQFTSNTHNFLVSTLICALFESLDFWIPGFKYIYIYIYILPKMDFNKYSKFHLKVKIHVANIFWVSNFHANLMNFASCLISYVCMYSFLPHNGNSSSPKLMISSSCLFSYFMSLDLLIFSFNPFFLFQNLKWFQLALFFSPSTWYKSLK